jgi:hypothetical protein
MVIHQDNLAFSVLNDNEVKVLHLYPRTSEVTRLVIPPHVQGYRVSVIAKKAFYECTKLRRVDLPPFLRSIEDEAFGLCEKLGDLESPRFSKSKLEEINLPDSITHIGKGAFEGTLALQKVVLPHNLAMLPEALFYDSAVSDVTLPDNITEIPTACFYDCRNLRRIVLPASVTKVAKDAFHYCTNLEEVVAPQAIDHIEMFDGEKKYELKVKNY